MKYILWSGGFDSTYLLCKELREGNEVQPIYIRFKSRGCIDKELESISDITTLLRNNGLPIRNIITRSNESKISDLKISSNITRYWMLKYFYGASREFAPLEIGIEAPAPSTREIGRLEQAMIDSGLIINDDGSISQGTANDETYDYVKNLCFPILKINARQEMEDFKKWGWENIAYATRSCVTSLIHACGVCPLCETKLKYGDTFDWMFSNEAKVHIALKSELLSISDQLAETYTKFVMDGGMLNFDGADRLKVIKKIRLFNKLEEQYPHFEESTLIQLKATE